MNRGNLIFIMLFFFLESFSQSGSIKKMEYFFDQDPGINMGIPLTISIQSDSINFDTSITVPSNMHGGVHKLYIRTFTDSNNRWSISEGREFYIVPKIVKAEYFFDQDPGIGNATNLTITTASDSISEDASIATSNSISNGFHKLYIRSMTSDSLWSISEPTSFEVFKGSILAAEYFIDQDPGLGMGTPLTISTPDDSVNLNYSIPISNSITNGFHRLYVRTKNIAGVWSLIESASFEVFKESLLASEYFIDVDPGVGMGTPLSIPVLSDSTNEDYSIVIPNNINNGFHRLYVRTKNKDGLWGLSESVTFEVFKSSLVQGEYFYDTDPGVGNGTPFVFSSPSDSVNEDFTITTSPTLSNGFHRLYFRSKLVSGLWGLTEVVSFYSYKDSLIGGEYFYDVDPGIGNGIPFTISAVGDSINQNLTVNTTGLSSGTHQLYVRTKNGNGLYSLSNAREFFIRPNLIKAEYFIDEDPGVGNGVNIPLLSNSDSINDNLNVIPYCATNGAHLFYLRTQDDRGLWSLSEPDTFYVSGYISSTHIIPGAGPDSTPVKLLGINGAGASYLYKNATLNTSYKSNPYFAIANGSTYVFYIKDTMGCISKDTIASIAKPTLISTIGGTKKIALTGYNNYVYFTDSSGNLLAAINDMGNNLDTVTVSCLINNGTIRYTPAFIDSFPYIDRNWKISSLNNTTANRGVQLPFLKSEYDSLNKAKGFTMSSVNDIKINKYNGANENLSLLDNDTSDANYKIVNASNPVVFNNSSQYISSFLLTSFSEFFISGNQLGTYLPIELLSFKAIKIDERKAQIVWITASEHDVSHFELERSIDGSNFETVSEKRATNTLQLVKYSVDDDISNLTGIIFYRLKSIDLDGKFELSKIQSISKSTPNKIVVYPNPTTSEININSNVKIIEVELRDVLNRVLLNVESGNKLDVSNISSGHYLMMIKTIDGQETHRIEIVK